MSQNRVMIPLNKIETSKVALRKAQTESDEFKNLQASIEEYGILHNLVVRESTTAEGMYTLIDGLQRFTIVTLIGLEEVPCVVLDADEQGALLLQVQGNIQNVATKPAEYAKQLVRILELDTTGKMTQNDLAELVCQSPDWVSARLALLRLHPEIQKMVDEGVICLQNARMLSQLDQEEQKQWVKRAASVPSEQFVPQCKARIMELKKAAREGKDTTPEVFTPVAKRRSNNDLLTEIAKPVARNALLTQDTTPVQAWKLALEWSMSLDPKTIAEAKAKWESDKAAREARKAEKAAAKKAAEEAKAAELEEAVL